MKYDNLCTTCITQRHFTRNVEVRFKERYLTFLSWFIRPIKTKTIIEENSTLDMISNAHMKI